MTIIGKTKRHLGSVIFLSLFGLFFLGGGLYHGFIISTISFDGIKTLGEITFLKEGVRCSYRDSSHHCYSIEFTYNDQQSNEHFARQTTGSKDAIVKNSNLIKITYSRTFPQFFVVNDYMLGSWISFVLGITLSLIFLIPLANLLLGLTPPSIMRKFKKK